MPPPFDYARRRLVDIGLLVGVVGTVLLAVTFFDVLLLVFAGVLVAVLLGSIAGWLKERTGLSRAPALALTLLSVVGLLALGGWLVGPELAKQTGELGQALVDGAAQGRTWLEGHPTFGRFADELPTFDDVVGYARDGAAYVPGAVTSLFSALSSFVVVLIVGVFFAANPDLYRAGLVRLVPKAGRARAREVIGRVGTALRKWLRGQFILMCFVGLACGTGLWLLGVPLAFALGFLAFLLDFIPILGPLLAAVPALMVAFVEGPQTALYVALLYLAVQQLESYALAPQVQKKMVDLPPAVLILAQVVMGGLAGLLGITLATPLAVVVIVLVQMLYVQDVLDDGSVHVLGEPKPDEDADDAEIPDGPSVPLGPALPE